jgi:hypothetical protein
MSLRSKRLALCVLGLLLVFGGFGARPASAHTGDQSYLYLDITETSMSGRVEMPFTDLREHLGLDLRGSTSDIQAELEAARDVIERYAADHLVLGAAGQTWPVTFVGVERLDVEIDDPDFGYALASFETTPATVGIPRQFDVTFDPFFDENPSRDALLIIGNDWGSGVIDNFEESLVRFAPDSRSQQIDLGDTSWFKNFSASVVLGLDHIRTGPDHIFFVLVLMLPSVLIFNSGWKPTASFTSSLWRVLKVVSMFTLAHTITFSLAGLGLLPLPSARFVETIIALSIAAAALHNIWPIARNREWLISFVFGLFHGMGFASLVSDLDVSRNTQLVSLIGRNIGIEIGQTIVVLLTFSLLFLLRRTRYYMPLFTAGSLLLVVVSVGWMLERLFDVPRITSTLVESAVYFPRVLLPLALATLLAAVVHRREDARGRLLAAHGDEGSEAGEPISVG